MSSDSSTIPSNNSTTLTNQPTNFIYYDVGDCIEFKHYSSLLHNNSELYTDVFEYTISNGKVINNDNPDILEVQLYNTNQIVLVSPSLIVRHYPKEKIPQLTPRIILRELWKDLVFREIKTVKAKDEYLITYDYLNHNNFVRTDRFYSAENALRSVDYNKHGNIHTHYKDYFGFTTHRAIRNNDIHCNQEIFFSRKCYGELNLTGRSITGNFSLRRGFKSIPPRKKQYICGLVEMGEKGLFYRKWFVCSREFLTLWTMVCEPEHYSLKNKTDQGYITKSLDELMIELDTSFYRDTTNYRSYNLDNNTLYVDGIYQKIANALFRPIVDTKDELYPSYEQKLKSDLSWMKQ